MSKRVAVCGMMTALAFLLSFIETLIPFSFGVQGVKLGLSNLVTVTVLYCLGAGPAFVISLVRIVLAGFAFTGLSVMLYSLAGGMLSFACMVLARRFTGLGITGVSALGGVTHNVGQLFVAALIVKNTAVFAYFPVLLAGGTAAGLVIGLLGALVTARIRPWLKTGKE